VEIQPQSSLASYVDGDEGGSVWCHSIECRVAVLGRLEFPALAWHRNLYHPGHSLATIPSELLSLECCVCVCRHCKCFGSSAAVRKVSDTSWRQSSCNSVKLRVLRFLERRVGQYIVVCFEVASGCSFHDCPCERIVFVRSGEDEDSGLSERRQLQFLKCKTARTHVKE
jgi:hypothetical protein